VGLLDFLLFGYTLYEFTPYTRFRSQATVREVLTLGSDLIFLQEIYHEDDIRVLLQETREIYPFSVASPKSSWPRLNSGLVVLSKFPIVESATSYFSAQAIDEFVFCPKGYLSGVLDHPSLGMVTFVNTHLTAGGLMNHPENQRAKSLRKLQIQQLLSSNTDALLLIGDLNCSPEVDSENFLLIKSHFDLDAALDLETQKGCFTWDPKNFLNQSCAHSTSPPQRIDHILIKTDGFTSCRVLFAQISLGEAIHSVENVTITASDHNALSVQFESHK
jgi:endonuclease/exonuclease/phosphatase family metal-dependent hydrolase